MIVLKAEVVCDQCGTRADVEINLATGNPRGAPKGWKAARFRPGVLRNTEPRPDRHFCSSACRDAAKASSGAE